MAAGLGGGVRAPIQTESGGERERANEWGEWGCRLGFVGVGEAYVGQRRGPAWLGHGPVGPRGPVGEGVFVSPYFIYFWILFYFFSVLILNTFVL